MDKSFNTIGNAATFSVLEASCIYRLFKIDETGKDRAAFIPRLEIYRLARTQFG